MARQVTIQEDNFPQRQQKGIDPYLHNSDK
jgi:hypothetical protein